MDRSDILGISIAAVILLPAAALAQQQQRPPQPPAQQQPQRPMKDMLAGAWSVLLVDGVKTDNTQTPLFGPNPAGSLIFTPNGRYSVQVMRTVNRAPFKSNNRDTGTADENKAVAQGTLSYFGTYAVDEGAKTLTLKIEASSFPNGEGGTQKWQVTALTDDVLTETLPLASSSIPGGGFGHLEVIWRKIK